MSTVNTSIAAASTVRSELDCPNLITILTVQYSTRFIIVFNFYWYIFWLRIEKEKLLQSDLGYSKQVPILLWSYHGCDQEFWPSVENALSPTTLAAVCNPNWAKLPPGSPHPALLPAFMDSKYPCFWAGLYSPSGLCNILLCCIILDFVLLHNIYFAIHLPRMQMPFAL